MVDIETQRLDDENEMSCIDQFRHKYHCFKLYALLFFITVGLPILILILGVMPQKHIETYDEFMTRQINKAVLENANNLGKYKCFYFFPNVIFIFRFIM